MTTWAAFFLFLASMCLLGCVAVLLFCLDRLGRMLGNITRLSHQLRRTANSFYPIQPSDEIPKRDNDGSSVEIKDDWNEMNDPRD